MTPGHWPGIAQTPTDFYFDESTSALDSATAEQFARTVNKLRGKVTLVFITHMVPKGLQIDTHLTLQGGASE